MFEKIKKFAEDNGLQLAGAFEHGRYKDGMVSITELLSILVDPSFEYIKQNHSEKLQQACDRGTKIHENIEKGINKNDPYYRRWREWKVLNGVKVLYKEKKYVRDNIRGNIDAVIESEEVTGPVDYKSSLRRNEKYCLQATGYCWLSGYTQAGVLYLSEDKYVYEIIDIEKYMPIFEDLVAYSKSIIAINPNEDVNEKRGFVNESISSQICTPSEFWSNGKSKKF